MERICRACGGVLGRDCFNEIECMSISAREESYKQGQYEELQRRFDKLLEILAANDINVSELMFPDSKINSDSTYIHESDDGLPF